MASVAPRWPLPCPENRALGVSRRQRTHTAQGIPRGRRQGMLRVHAPKGGDGKETRVTAPGVKVGDTITCDDKGTCTKKLMQ